MISGKYDERNLPDLMHQPAIVPEFSVNPRGHEEQSPKMTSSEFELVLNTNTVILSEIQLLPKLFPIFIVFETSKNLDRKDSIT